MLGVGSFLGIYLGRQAETGVTSIVMEEACGAGEQVLMARSGRRAPVKVSGQNIRVCQRVHQSTDGWASAPKLLSHIFNEFPVMLVLRGQSLTLRTTVVGRESTMFKG